MIKNEGLNGRTRLGTANFIILGLTDFEVRYLSEEKS